MKSGGRCFSGSLWSVHIIEQHWGDICSEQDCKSNYFNNRCFWCQRSSEILEILKYLLQTFYFTPATAHELSYFSSYSIWLCSFTHGFFLYIRCRNFISSHRSIIYFIFILLCKNILRGLELNRRLLIHLTLYIFRSQKTSTDRQNGVMRTAWIFSPFGSETYTAHLLAHIIQNAAAKLLKDSLRPTGLMLRCLILLLTSQIRFY